MHQSSGRWALGLALSLLTAFLWGILPIALVVTVQALDVYTVIWFRFFVSFTLLATYLGLRGKLPSIKQINSTTGKLLAIAIIGLAGNYCLFLQGLALTTPTNAEVIFQLSIPLLSFGGLVIFKERYTLGQWLGVTVLTLGFMLFFNEKLTDLTIAPSKYIFGSALVVLATIAWTLYALAQKQLLLSFSSPSIMVIVYGGCAFLFTPFVKLQTIFTVDTLQLGTLLFCSLNTLIAYGAFAESLQHWQASRVSAILALAPMITFISAWLLSGIAPALVPTENFSLIGIFGGLLVVCGSVIIALGKAD